jgi:hypothetical protein
MTNETLRDLLARLRDEIHRTDVDAATRTRLRELDEDIHALLDEAAADPNADVMLDRARRLEASFASSHPTAERIMREVIDALAKIGL